MVQCLRLCFPNAGTHDSIPGQGTQYHIMQLKSWHATTKRPHVPQLRPHATKKKTTPINFRYHVQCAFQGGRIESRV